MEFQEPLLQPFKDELEDSDKLDDALSDDLEEPDKEEYELLLELEEPLNEGSGPALFPPPQIQHASFAVPCLA